MHPTLAGTVGLVTALAALQPAPSHAEARAPTAIDAKMCRMLAYENYPQERPGKSVGSGARYQFYRDCLDKRTAGGQQPAPQTPEKQR